MGLGEVALVSLFVPLELVAPAGPGEVGDLAG